MAMTNKRIRAPEGGPRSSRRTLPASIDDGDVEGHGLPTTAPPSRFGRIERPSQGGEIIPTDDDDDGKGRRALDTPLARGRPSPALDSTPPGPRRAVSSCPAGRRRVGRRASP